MTPVEKLAIWIRSHVPRTSGPVSHLKLQKLLFYCYGGALAFDHEAEVGDIVFEAWRHGPVNPETVSRYRSEAGALLPPPTEAVSYSADVEATLSDVLGVYAWLKPWALRQQSHLETPWIEASNRGGQSPIDRESIRQHFIGKLRRDVRLPEYLGRTSSSQIDGIPSASFRSLHDLAQQLRARLG